MYDNAVVGDDDDEDEDGGEEEDVADDVEEEDDDGEEADRSEDRCAVEMHLDISEEPLYAPIYRKLPGPKTGDHTLGEPAQLKRTWRFHKNHPMQKFAGENAGAQSGHSD